MATIVDARPALVLEHSKWLRLLTLLLFYFAQGFPTGMFFYAVPAWMAASGATVAATAAVVSAAIMPWTLKFVNGFIIDRYTYLPMGRRRSWIITAQSVMIAALIGGAFLSPEYSDTFLISAIAFAANFGIAFQDVGIDSLAIDIMPDDERAKAAGIMFGAQAVGIATATALGGLLLERFGFTIGLIGASIIPLGILAYGIAIKEREGEKRLPWSDGQSHPANQAIQIDAWKPLLIGAFKAIFAPLSLVLMPVLFLKNVIPGGFEAFHPTLFTNQAGWAISDYTGLTSSAFLMSGIAMVLVGGLLIDKIGSRMGIWVSGAVSSALLIAMGSMPHMWTTDWFLIGFIVGMELFMLLWTVAAIPIFMKLCTPAVAATQFTIYMAMANFGRPAGAGMASWATAADNPQWIYFICAGCLVVAMLIVTFVTLPRGDVDPAVASELPSGDETPPRID